MNNPNILFLDRIGENPEELLDRANLRQSDMTLYKKIQHPTRQREWLQSKVIVWQQLNQHITYLPDGSPSLEQGSLSISHSKDKIAVLYSPDSRCAVDIEHIERNVEKITRKFTTQSEIELLSSSEFSENPALLVWSLKETLYKYCRIEGAQFMTDFKILSVEGKTVTALAFEENIELQVWNNKSVFVVFTPGDCTIINNF